MRILSPLQPGLLQKPFSFNDRHFLCVSLLWAFRLDSGEVVLESEMWQALSDLFSDGRIFDQGMPKDRAEFLCLGSFHAPEGKPVMQEAVSVRVGDRTKKLLVSGPRTWRTGGATRPRPITRLPIRYNEAFGGEGFADNPIGKGFVADTESGERPLPCVEYPREAITSPSNTPRAASLEPLDLTWRPRQRYAGTYDDEYMRKRMPGLPDDIDWRLFNDAPQDQWFDGFLRGDEPFELLNMTPDRSRLAGHLPGVHGRAFIEKRRDPTRRESELEFREIPTRLDTVWLLPDAGLGVLIHRGTTEIATDDGTDVVNLMTAYENLADPDRTTEHYRGEMTRRADPENGFRYMLDTRALLPAGYACAIQELVADDDMQMENLGQQNGQAFGEQQKRKAEERIDEQAEELRAQLEPHGQHMPEEAANLDQQIASAKQAVRGEAEPSAEQQELERIMEKIAPGASGGGQVDITQVDFDAFDELQEYTDRLAAEQRELAEQTLRDRIEDLRQQNNPEREELTRAIAEAERALAAMNEPAPLPRPKLDIDLDQVQQQMDVLDQYRDELRAGGVDEQEIKAQIPDMGPIREQLAEAEKKIAEQYRDGAHFMDECVSPHPGEEADLRARLLAATAGAAATGDYAFVDLSGVTLRDLDLTDAYLEYVNFTGATLIGVNLTGAILARAHLRDCRFEDVNLKNANVGATTIDGAVFEDCDLTEARLGRAKITRARFERCRLMERQEMFLETELEEVQFINCMMEQTNFLERDLSNCVFRGSQLTQSNFIQGDLTGADFTEAVLTGVNIVSTRAPRARFDRATMDNTRFIDEPVLNDTSFREAHLHGANLREADLAGADLAYADLEGADLSGAWLTGANLDRAGAVGANFQKTELANATLRNADLREALLMKARMQRTKFTRANLYSVSFLFSTLGETEFSGANMDNTILRDWRPRGG